MNARRRKPTQEQLKRTPREPSGTAYPVIKSDVDEVTQTEAGIPIVLTWSTIWKIMWPALGLVTAALSGGALLYWKSATHLTDHVVHLGVGERVQLETRKNAEKERSHLLNVMRLEQKESALEHKEQLRSLEKELRNTRSSIVREIRSQ